MPEQDRSWVISEALIDQAFLRVLLDIAPTGGELIQAAVDAPVIRRPTHGRR